MGQGWGGVRVTESWFEVFWGLEQTEKLSEIQ